MATASTNSHRFNLHWPLFRQVGSILSTNIKAEQIRVLLFFSFTKSYLPAPLPDAAFVAHETCGPGEHFKRFSDLYTNT